MPGKWIPRLAALAASNAVLAVLALLAGLGAAWGARHYLDGEARRIEAAAAARYQPVAVVVANADLAAGTRLDTAALALREMPAAFLPAGHLTAASAATLVGQRTRVELRRGDVVTPALLANGEQGGLSLNIPDGLRAVTLPVDDVSSQAGLLAAGDAVDLYLSQSRDTGTTRIGLLLQDVPVLATGTQLAREAGAGRDTGYATITLLASAEDSARLVLAQQSGSLSVVLRGRGDAKPVLLGIRDSSQLLSGAAHAARAVRTRAGVEVLIGGEGTAAPRRSWLQTGGRS